MKITRQQLKRIIREEYSRLKRKELIRESKVSIDELSKLFIGDITKVRQAVKICEKYGVIRRGTYTESTTGAFHFPRGWRKGASWVYVEFECAKELYRAILHTLADHWHFNALDWGGSQVEGRPVAEEPGSSFRGFYKIGFYVELQTL